MKKIIRFSFIITLVIIMFCPFSYAEEQPEQQAVFITEKNLAEKVDRLSVTGKIPQVNFVQFDRLVEQAINTKINEKYKHRLASAAAANATAISFDYEMRQDGDYLSLMIKSETVAAEPQTGIDIINIDTALKKIIYIHDVLGPNGVKISNQVVRQEAAAELEIHTSESDIITNEHDFYIENNFLILVFNKNEISIDISKVVNLELLLDPSCVYPMYFIDGSAYNLKIIPLRYVLEAFGFEIEWVGETMTVHMRRGESFYSSLQINENKYFRNTSPKRSLEAAPILIKDRTYVPISFFEEFISLFYMVDADGTITFSEYLY